MAQLSDKVVLISGATSGIGEASACSLAKMGAHVILHGRNDLKCQSAIERIKEECPNASLDFITADLSSITDVRLACESLKNQYHKLDVLINNAGSFYLSHHLSLDGIEMTMAINHIAHFVLTVSVMGLLLESPDARIINVSSNAHVGVKLNLDSFEANKVKRVNGFQAYAQSKLANIYFTYELAKRLKGSQITANALHPGFVATRIGMNNGRLVEKLIKYLQIFKLLNTKTPEQGAQTSIFLATSDSVNGISGKYYVDCEPIPSSQESYDEIMGEQLWNWSIEKTGIDLVLSDRSYF